MAAVSITLTDAWINLASDPTQSVHVGRRAASASTSINGEVRQYGPGRLRAVLRDGIIGRPTLTFRTTDRTIVKTLGLWVGQTVCLRDELGRLDWCMFFEVPEIDLELERVEVTLAFQNVTYSPAV